MIPGPITTYYAGKAVSFIVVFSLLATLVKCVTR